MGTEPRGEDELTEEAEVIEESAATDLRENYNPYVSNDLIEWPEDIQAPWR